MAGEGESSTGSGAGGSNYMSNLAATFDPTKDDLEQYTQKVKLLAEIWPKEKYNELIARLILGTTGSAFQKLQLKRADLMTGSKAGVQTLVDLLGGQWGKVSLERKYEIVERALFKCTQRQDETNDSYLARSDVVWTELLKGIDIAEVQAYILLRGSLLSSEDRQRVVLESEAEKSGALTVDKVSKAIRKLGATFFQEMIGTKKSKGKVYEPTALAEQVNDEEENAFHAEDDLAENEFVSQLLQQNDEDAALVADFEAAAGDVLQSDEDLAAAYNTYADARRRLSDRYKNRGFWPISQKGRGKGHGHAGKGAKGKSFGRGPRKSLQQRMMETTCRMKPGHWKAECPERNKGSASSTNAPVSAAMTVMTENSQEATKDQVLPMEFMQLPVIHEPNLDASGTQHVYVVNIEKGTVWDRIRNRGRFYSRKSSTMPVHEPRNEDAPIPTGKDRSVICECCETEAVFFTSQGTNGILDTGATKSVVGSNLLASLIESLDPKVRKHVFRTQCNITFRFGNQGTLDSNQALVIPLQSIGLGLKIAIVKGNTPLLLSNTLLRTLKASLNSEVSILTSPLLRDSAQLQLSPRGLYLMDLNDLIEAHWTTKIKSPNAETYFSSDQRPKSIEKTNSSNSEEDQDAAHYMSQLTKPRTIKFYLRFHFHSSATPPNAEHPDQIHSVKRFWTSFAISILNMSLASRLDRALKAPSTGNELQEFMELDLESMGQTQVTFGKTHVGRRSQCHPSAAGDIDHDFEEVHHNHTRPNHLKSRFQKLVQCMTQELQEVADECQSNPAQPCIQLLEVFCSPNSELSKQVQNLGFRSQRHGLSEGDLDTKEGRRTLFKEVITKRPRNIWYSPTCGPWSAWSILNEAKSIKMFDQIHQQRLQNLGHLALGLVLYRHQLGSGRHLHWEQPSKSIMFRSHLLSEILQQVFVAEFDMCNVGQLRDPENQLL